MSVRACDRCTGATKAGGRCSRRTCKTGPYCWQHTKSILGVQVKKSEIAPRAGLGLFAAKDFKKKENIVDYTGKVIRKSMSQLDQDEARGKTHDYVLSITNNYHVDAKKTNSSVGRYANDCMVKGKRKRKRCNAKFVVNRRNKTARIQTTKKVKKGTEFLVSYGNEYWKGR